MLRPAVTAAKPLPDIFVFLRGYIWLFVCLAMKPNGGTVKDGAFYWDNLRSCRKIGACAAALQKHRPKKI